MAAYAATVTLLSGQHIRKGNGPGPAIAFGTIHITNYHQTLVEITAISALVKTGGYVVMGGTSATGYTLRWNTTSKSFECWNGSTQCSSDVAVGVAPFTVFANIN